MSSEISAEAVHALSALSRWWTTQRTARAADDVGSACAHVPADECDHDTFRCLDCCPHEG